MGWLQTNFYRWIPGDKKEFWTANVVFLILELDEQRMRITVSQTTHKYFRSTLNFKPTQTPSKNSVNIIHNHIMNSWWSTLMHACIDANDIDSNWQPPDLISETNSLMFKKVLILCKSQSFSFSLPPFSLTIRLSLSPARPSIKCTTVECERIELQFMLYFHFCFCFCFETDQELQLCVYRNSINRWRKRERSTCERYTSRAQSVWIYLMLKLIRLIRMRLLKLFTQTILNAYYFFFRMRSVGWIGWQLCERMSTIWIQTYICERLKQFYSRWKLVLRQ